MHLLIPAFKRPAQAGAGDGAQALRGVPRGVARRWLHGACVLAWAAALAACATQQPERPPPRPTQGTGMKCAMPEYPMLARRLEVQAQVTVRLTVALDGSVGDVHVEQSALAGRDWTGLYREAAQALDAAALRMGKSCRFAPVVGHHAPARVRLPVMFKLHD